MCTSAKNYLCGGFFGNFQDKHFSPPGSDDEDETGNDADSEAEKEKYMPKDHKKAVRGLVAGKLGFRKLGGPDSRMLSMGWGPYMDVIAIEVQCGKDTVVQRFQAIVATRETITEQMLGNLGADNRSEQLHTLELTHCKLKKSFPNIGGLHALRVCKLSHNEIIVLKKSNLAEGMNVEWLVIDYNKLEALEPRAISSEFLPQLKVLNFAHNKLSFLPQCFTTGLDHLRYLDLSYNKLQQLPEAIGGCSNLQLCFLQANELSKLPAGIHRLSKLRKLFVSYNHLTSLPELIGDCKALEKLQVSSNKIALVPDSIIELWKKKGGRLEEFRVDGNPLTQPGLSAFDKGQLDIGFELFEEWLQEELAERTAKEQAEALKLENERRHSIGRGELTIDVVNKVEATLEKTNNALKHSFSNLSKSDQIFVSDTYTHQLDQNTTLQKVIADGDDVDDMAEARMEVEGSMAQAFEDLVELQKQNEDEDYYFQHLQDAHPPMDTEKMAALRSLESSMLLLKKVKYVEGRKALARAKREECAIAKKEMPRHLEKYLDDDLTAATFTGTVPVTAFDLHFCILVYSTKPLESNCAALFEQFQGNADYIKRGDWDDLCTHVKVKIPKDIQQEMWELIAWNKDSINRNDFIAAWHIHDIESKDPWIRRAARVLKLNYYNMDLSELRERLRAKSATEAEMRAGEGENGDFGFDSSEGKGNSSSSEESDESQEEARRQRMILEVPVVEGERRRALPEKRPIDAGGTARGGRGGPRESTRQPPQPLGKGGGSAASNGRADLGVPLGKVSLTEDQQFALSRMRDDEDSGQESASSGDTFPSEELSVTTNSSVSSFDARSQLGHMESDEEAVQRENSAAQSGQRMEIKSDLDILRLMDMSPQEVLAAPPKKQKDDEAQKANTDLIKKKVRELRSKNTQKDARFRTDVFTVRLALREARRNMTVENFTTLVNFLLRSLKHMEHSTSSKTYWHVDNPNFRHATGVESINPYVRQLLEQMGFVCLHERYWVWPEKHLSLSDMGCWGRREVKSGCAGRDAMRILDMVELFSRYQKSLWRARQG